MTVNVDPNETVSDPPNTFTTFVVEFGAILRMDIKDPSCAPISVNCIFSLL